MGVECCEVRKKQIEEFGQFLPMLETMKRMLDKNKKIKGDFKKEYEIVIAKEK